MLYNCESLISLDLSNFNVTYIYDYYYWNIFYGCNSLKYINLYSYIGIDIFENIPTINLKYCMYDNDILSLTNKNI